MKRTHAIITGIVTAAALAVCIGANAQSSNGAGQTPAPAASPRSGHGPRAGADPAARVESRLTDLKARLAITPAQEAAWQTYAAQVKKRATDRKEAHARSKEVNATAAERMAQRTTDLQRRAAGMAETTRAFGTLYAALTPEQKAVADSSVAIRHGEGRHHGHHHGAPAA